MNELTNSNYNDDLPIEPWKYVWRYGFAPNLSSEGLECLREALVSDDPRLLQGSTTFPPPLYANQDLSIEAGCVICFCEWQGLGFEKIGEVEERFANLCYAADQALGKPAECRYFLNFWDDLPRNMAISQLLPEVVMEIERRKKLFGCDHIYPSIQYEPELGGEG